MQRFDLNNRALKANIAGICPLAAIAEDMERTPLKQVLKGNPNLH